MLPIILAQERRLTSELEADFFFEMQELQRPNVLSCSIFYFI